MTVDKFKTYFDMAWPILSGILLGAVILAVGWMVSKWASSLVRKACTKAKVNEALARFFGSMARYTVLVATVIAALGAVGIQTTSLLAVLATAGLAIGLALQGSLANVASASNELVVIPNAAITSGNITNYTRLGARRAAIPVSVAYGTNLVRAQEVLLRAVSSCTHVHLRRRPPSR